MAATTKSPLPEQWAQDDGVRQLLGYMLAQPQADHRVAVHAELGNAPLGEAQKISLFRAAEKDWWKNPKNPQVTKNKAVALHTWLYHLLGGKDAELIPPPTTTTDAVANEFSRLRRKAIEKDEAAFVRELETLRKLSKSTDTAAEGLAAIAKYRNAPVSPDLLRRHEAPDPAEHKVKGKSVAGGDGGGAPSATEAELQRRSSWCLSLAMGTHGRLGVESVVRSISGQHDALRLIAKHAGMRTTTWLPQPPAREVLVLRKSVHREHGLAFNLQQQVDELVVENTALQKSNERLVRQVESAEQRMQEAFSGCERRMAEEADHVQVKPRLPPPPLPLPTTRHCYATACRFACWR